MFHYEPALENIYASDPTSRKLLVKKIFRGHLLVGRPSLAARRLGGHGGPRHRNFADQVGCVLRSTKIVVGKLSYHQAPGERYIFM